MKTIHDKLSQVAPSLNNGENISSGDCKRDIKLEAVTSADRKRLRIASYQYILP